MSFKTLEYYYVSGEHVIFDKYEICEDTTIRNKNTKKVCKKYLMNGYYKISLCDEHGKSRPISVARTMLSTFCGKPPTTKHTADHIISSEKTNDLIENLRWADKTEQSFNQVRRETHTDAILIRYDGECMTAKDWALRENVHENAIIKRAHKNDSWKFKEHEDLPGEKWLLVKDSETHQGFWKVSDNKRVAYHTKYTRNVRSSEELFKQCGYPSIRINGKRELLHIIIFKTFRPEEFAAMNHGDMIMHMNDDKNDCVPWTLKIGTRSMNVKDAYDNGRYDGTKSQRKKCACYKDDDLVKEFVSLRDAERWLRIKNPRASYTSVRDCLIGRSKSAYGYNWKVVHHEKK